MDEIRPGTYKHYKGGIYEVIDVARHADSLEEFVVYRGLYDSEEFGQRPLWIRPKSVFVEHVIIDGVKVPRFLPL